MMTREEETTIKSVVHQLILKWDSESILIGLKKNSAYVHKDLVYMVSSLLEVYNQAQRAVIEQYQVQLAGCLTSAEGATMDPAKQGDYGWSPAYQATLELRLRYEQQAKENQALREALQAIVNDKYSDLRKSLLRQAQQALKEVS